MRNLLAFPDDAKVWIYQADRPFDETDVERINDEIDAFSRQWTTHNRDLHAIGGVLHDRFVVLMVDESASQASGCSIDKSVAFIKNLEHKYHRNLLQRDIVAWLDENEQIHTLPLGQLKDAISEGKLNMESKVFDNLVATRGEFIRRWTAPLASTWMKRFT